MTLYFSRRGSIILCVKGIINLMNRARIVFSGIVQGVGFRYKATAYARDARLLGQVRNLSDGRVEAIAEGPRDVILNWITSIQDYFQANITDTQVEWSESRSEFIGFNILS